MRGILSHGAFAVLAAMSAAHDNRIFGAGAIDRAITQTRKAKAYGNTSRYFPHQGKREVARRQRQAAKKIS